VRGGRRGVCGNVEVATCLLLSVGLRSSVLSGQPMLPGLYIHVCRFVMSSSTICGDVSSHCLMDNLERPLPWSLNKWAQRLGLAPHGGFVWLSHKEWQPWLAQTCKGPTAMVHGCMAIAASPFCNLVIGQFDPQVDLGRAD
jgi:hypothetical protein